MTNPSRGWWKGFDIRILTFDIPRRGLVLDSEGIYTVSEITREIKGLLDEHLVPLWVEGEVSNYVHHTSGHRYFTLKDEASQLRCVMWKWQGRLFFRPEDGMKVVAYGRISVYERGGQYQLVVSELQPAGIGELQLAFEQLKERLAAEGLFEESRKRALPVFPQRIGVVTSPTGAAIRDIAQVIGRRFPSVQIVLWPARVQGEGAAEEIAKGIEKLNTYGEVDVIIVGRGGGSLEDLWAFNEEEVARAIYGSHIPVVSAVGHEIDFVIADFVADRRAPTPSAAAEMVVRDGAELMREVGDLRRRAGGTLTRWLEEGERRVRDLGSRYAFRRIGDVLTQYGQQVDELEHRAVRAFDHGMGEKVARYRGLMGRLDALSPLSALHRGFSVCRRMPEGLVVTDSAALDIGDRVEVRFERGKAVCLVEERSP